MDTQLHAARRVVARAGYITRYIAAAGLAAAGVEQLVDPMPTSAAVAGATAAVAAGRVNAAWLRRTGRIPAHVGDPLEYVRDQALRAGGGAFIGVDDTDHTGIVHAPADSAVLVLGPPRRGSRPRWSSRAC